MATFKQGSNDSPAIGILPGKAAPGRNWVRNMMFAAVAIALAACHGTGKQDKPDSTAAASVETGRGEDASPGARAHAAGALLDKSSALIRQGKAEEGSALCDEIIRLYGEDASSDMRKTVARVRDRKTQLLR
ncbi:MAG: hypothetical protein LBE06_09615 [Azoarcus sp.]|jgi:hypothetical protein|nr:hypothetical protein [Azoarcus sp.]